MKKALKNVAIWTLVCLALGYGAGVLISFLQNESVWDESILTAQMTLIMLALGGLLGIAFGLSVKTKEKKSKSTGKTASGAEYALHFDASFMTKEQILNDKFLINTSWNALPALKNTGSFVKTEKNGSRYEVTMKDEMHTLIIGTTGTGKTSMVIDPAIRIYAHSQEKPSLVIADPKGELYGRHAKALIEEGYDVKIYDLDNPYASSRWNPMDRPYEMFQKAINLAKTAKKYSGCTPKQAGKEELEGVQYGNTWYELGGVAFPDEESLNKEISAQKQKMIGDAKFELRGIAAAVCPISQGTNDSMWEAGAQDYLYGIMLAMLEDTIDNRLGENKLRQDQFNFYNLYKISQKKDSDPDNPFGSVRKYCTGRSKTSEVLSITSGVINAAPSTAKSYLSVLSTKITALMQDMGICYATSGTDIDFNKFVDKPTAFFIKIPDHKKERHSLATICISQLYRCLVDAANKYPRMKLPRHVYFLLDEFGNLPVIQDFATMVTVSRSRNIFFQIVVQSFTQLDTKYGKEVAETLKGNFNIQIFLGTEDTATREAFSKSCGEVQLITEEESKSKTEGKDNKSTSTSTSTQRTVVPLVPAYELSTLPFGTAIIKIFRYNPIRCTLPQFHVTAQFEKFPPLVASRTSKSLNEEQVFFDIDKRNQIVLGRPNFF